MPAKRRSEESADEVAEPLDERDWINIKEALSAWAYTLIRKQPPDGARHAEAAPFQETLSRIIRVETALRAVGIDGFVEMAQRLDVAQSEVRHVLDQLRLMRSVAPR